VGRLPDARVHAPSELRTKRPDLRLDRLNDLSDDDVFDGVDEVPIRGFRLRETALIHRAARTAVVADLVSNIGRPEHPWTRLYSTAMGFYDRVALSRLLRWTSFDDRGAARLSVDTLLNRNFDSLVVGHGAPVRLDARNVLASATAWLLSSAPPVTDGKASRAFRWSPGCCG
jgi:hypothetical protein